MPLLVLGAAAVLGASAVGAYAVNRITSPETVQASVNQVTNSVTNTALLIALGVGAVYLFTRKGK